MPTLSLRFLGAPQILLGDKPVTKFVTSKAKALLIYLTSNPGMHTRDALAGLFWPDMAESSAKNNLRRTLPNLRRLVGDHLLINNRTIAFNRKADYWLDLEDFTHLALEVSDSSKSKKIPLETLAAKAELYRGEFVHGFHVPNAPEFEQWVLMQREHLRGQAIRMLTEVAQRYIWTKDFEAGLDTTRRLLYLEPWCEIAHYQQMILLAHNGQRALALAQYETCRSLLQKEFGAEPSAEMTAQYQRIKAGARSTIETIFPEHSPNEPHEPPSHREAREIPPAKFTTQVDWGDIPRQATFYNRQEEITQLRHRLVGNPHSVVGLIGTGGMGKTVLAAHMVRILATQDAEVGSLRREMRFEHIIWRSLINAPSLYTIVRSWVQILTDDPPIQWPTDINDLLDLLFELLQKKRCLLILDNLESILQEDTHAGYFQDGHENYAVLLRRMGETVHRSCLFFTSRELPIIVAQLERSHSMVWTEYLKGFDTTSGVQLLMAEGLAAPPSELAQLVEGYSGNPLALKLVAETVQYLYGNNVAAFLRDRALIFDDIRTVLDQQFNRLLPFEKEILCWLAIERKPVPLQKLSNNWVQTPPQRKFLEAVRSLQRRGLIEYVTEAMATNGRNGALASLTPCFTLQNVVMEFVSDQVVERIFSELVGTPIADSQLQHSSVAQFKLNRYGLLKSHSQIYVRDMQVRLLLQPLLRRLLDQWGRTHTVTHLRQWIDYLRREQFGLKGYAGANILHMLLYLDVDLTNWDFSRIYIRQADLRAASMINVDLRGADLTGSTFANIMGSVTALAMSPNGQYLTSSSSDGDICIWHMQDFQIHCMLQGHKHAINSLCFANDGSLLLSGGVDGFINVWDVASGKLIRSMKNLDKSIIAISLHCDDIYLAVALTDETIQIWNWQQTELVKTLHTSSTLEDVTFSPDGKFLVSVGDEQQINVWKVDNFELLHSLEGHAGKILAVAFNAKSNLLATAGEDKQIWMWDVDTFQLQQVLTGHTDLVLALSFSQNGHFLASSSADQTARTWNLQTGKLDRLFNDHYGWVNSVTFGANDQTLITGGYDQTIRVWEPHSGQLRLALKGHLKRVDFISFGADGQYLAASSLDGLVHLWNVQTATLHHVLKDSKAATRGLVFNRACTLLVTASDDHNIRLWNTHTGQMRQLLRGHTGFVRSIQFSADEQFVISGSRDYSIRIWEVSSGKLMRTISDVNATIQFAFAVSPTQPYLAYGALDHTVNVIDLNNTQTVHQINIAPATATVTAFDPSGRRLACGTQTGHVFVYEQADSASEYRLLYHIQHTTTPIWRLLFSPNGEKVAWNCAGQEIRCLDLKSGQVSPVIPTYYGAFCLGFSQDSTQLFTDGPNHALLVRDPMSGKIHRTLYGHSAGLTSIEVSPAGDKVATSSGDGSIRLWDTHSGDCLAVLQFTGPYAGMNITGAIGISNTQHQALLALGAIDENPRALQSLA